MNVRTLFVVNAVVALVFGLGFALFPETVLSLYTPEKLNAVGSLIARLFGAELISVGVGSWFFRHGGHSTERDGFMLGIIIGNTVGFLASLIGMLNKVVGPLGWSTVAIYLLLALGFAYFRFMAKGR